MSANLSLHSAPDAIEPVVGWRVWRVFNTNDGLRLGSVVYWQRQQWAPRERHKAECLAFAKGERTRCDDAPHRPCTCGIYAARHVAGARGYVSPYSLNTNQGVCAWLAIGRVNLWGRIVEHKDGYRAQYAYPKQILLPARISSPNGKEASKVPDLPVLADRLRDIYGVPVLIVHPKRGLLERLKGAA